jgi:hypothetical protein
MILDSFSTPSITLPADHSDSTTAETDVTPKGIDAATKVNTNKIQINRFRFFMIRSAPFSMNNICHVVLFALRMPHEKF